MEHNAIADGAPFPNKISLLLLLLVLLLLIGFFFSFLAEPTSIYTREPWVHAGKRSTITLHCQICFQRGKGIDSTHHGRVSQSDSQFNLLFTFNSHPATTGCPGS